MINWLLFNIHTINLLYAVAGLLVLGATLVLAYDYYCNKQALYQRFLAPYIWWLVIVTSVGGVATTLLYSEIFGFVPCSLCWLQRIALYPLALLGLVAFYSKDTKQFPLYGIALSVFGLIVAVYHFIYQSLPKDVDGSSLMPCLADGSADCAKKVMEVFGFVTFPFLSAVIFAFLIVLYLHMRRAANSPE